MNKLTKILAVFLMLLAACLAALAWWLGRQPPTTTPLAAVEPAPFHTLVIANGAIQKGTRIEAKDLKVIDSPRPIPGSYHSIAHVTGRIASSDIPADTLLTEGNLLQGVALQLADGERAIALPVDEVVGVGHKLDPGDYVDVFVILKQGNPTDKGHARLLASRLRVLAYGSEVIGTIDSPGTPLSKPQGQAAQIRTAVLATPVEDVNSLLLASQNGKLALALRHPSDSGIASSDLFPSASLALLPRSGLSSQEKQILMTADNRAFAGIEISSWAGENQKRAAPPRTTTASSTPLRTLEVIKGAQREQVRY